MTLQLRPTFSESWYRVKTLKVKLRPGAQISRQYYRGERWYVVRDPAGNQFHRLSDPAYRFVGLLDGSRTVEEAWDLCGGTMADDAPTQPEVIQILTHLYGANLIDADVTPDATVLLRRHKDKAKKKFQNRLMNVLFPRIPLWDPDRFLVRWMPLVRQMLSKFGAFVWLAVVISACVLVANKSREPGYDLTEAAKHAVNLETNKENVVWLWAVFVFVKLIHELGHAFSCRRFGGECHELGIMFLVFIPTPYVDASTAWGFASKWQRIFVGAGGMIVELFFASLCAFVWINVPPTSFAGQLSFNAMLVASVTTIIFNANPLLRYDGYYILSDWLEIPNLRQKSQEYTLGLIKRHVFRVKQQQPLPPVVQRFWLFVYYCTSGVYRIFVGVMIILLVAFQIPILGILMAVGGVITWLVMPVFKVFKYLTIEPELHRKRGRATAFVLAVTAVAVVVIGVIPMPVRLYAMGIVEPAADKRATVVTTEGGRVVEVKAADGDVVTEGQVILVCQSDEIDGEITMKEAEIKSYRIQRDGAVSDNPAARKGFDEAIANAQVALAELKDKKKNLTVLAPTSGKLVAPGLKNMAGQYVQAGAQVGMVYRSEDLTIHVAVPQEDAELLPYYDKLQQADRQQAEELRLAAEQNREPRLTPVTLPKLQTDVRLASDIKTVIDATQAQRSTGAATAELRHPSLGQAGGGQVANDPQDPRKSMHPVFDIEVPIANPGDALVPWQRAHVRFTVDHKPLAWQWARKVRQLIGEHAAGSKWL